MKTLLWIAGIGVVGYFGYRYLQTHTPSSTPAPGSVPVSAGNGPFTQPQVAQTQNNGKQALSVSGSTATINSGGFVASFSSQSIGNITSSLGLKGISF